MKRLTDLSGRCGSCKWYTYFVRQRTNHEGKLLKSMGHCYNQDRTLYHDSSQKACKLYEPMEQEESEVKE